MWDAGLHFVQSVIYWYLPLKGVAKADKKDKTEKQNKIPAQQVCIQISTPGLGLSWSVQNMVDVF